MVEAGFEGTGKYITRKQKMIVQYIETRPILDLCQRSARRPWERVSQRWWKQAGLGLEEAKKRAAVAAAELDGEEMIGEERRGGDTYPRMTTGRE